jgi:hypothetical protein
MNYYYQYEHFYGILNILGQWFKSNLHDRKQQVVINTVDSNNSIYSDWGVIKHGVAEGSVVGPQILSHISMTCPQPLKHSLNLPSLLMTLVLLFHMKKLTASKIA